MNQEVMNFYIPEKLLKASDVARILNISRALSYRLMQQGEIRVVRINRAVRVRPADLEHFILNCLSSDLDLFN